MLEDGKILKRPRIKTRHPLSLRRPPRLNSKVAKKGIKPIRKPKQKTIPT